MGKLSYKELENELLALKKSQNLPLKNEEYKTLFDSMPEMIEVIELIYNNNDEPIDFYIRDLNLSFAKLLGRTKEQLIDKKVSSVVSIIEDNWFDYFGSVDKTGKSIRFKNYGAEFDKYYFVTAWKISKNRIGASFTDITQNEKEKIKAKKFNKTILDIIPSDIAVFDKKHNYLYVNPKGIGDDETRKWIIGKTDFDYCKLKGIDDSLAKGRRAIFNRVIKTKKQIEWVDEYEKDGKIIYLMRRLYPVFIDDILQYVIGHGIDISEQKIAQKQLKELNNSLEEKIKERTIELINTERKLRGSLRKEIELNELKSKFISTASHEFRTPLSVITFAAGAIKKYKSKMEPMMIENKLTKIENQAIHMTALLEDILLVGRADAGKISNKPVHLNLGDFILKIIEEVISSSQESHKIELIDTEKLKDSDLFIDEKLGRNIFINLISNAVKFSPDAKKVIIELSSEKKYTVISITDFGIGIPKSELKNIFTPFRRGKNVDLIQGTGLGLSIVEGAINVIAGKISVQSTIGHGATFIVKIPKI
jgi:signal transduction histidine kinase